MSDLYSAVQYILFVIIITIFVKPLGGYLDRVFARDRTLLDRFCQPIERLIYRITGTDPALEMTFSEYATCFVLFGLFCTLALYSILRLQRFFPWFFSNFQTTPLSPDLAVNTSISFSTTTTRQAYGGENAMSYFSNLDGGVRLIQLVQHRSSCVLHRPSFSTKLSKNSRHRRGLSS
jgi:K+-transporting ATPase ATPase A chain